MGRISQLNVINQAVKDKGIFYVIKRASFILIYLAYHKLFSKQKFFTFKVNRMSIFMILSIIRG